MMAFVRGVTAASMSAGSMQAVSRSTSTSTGLAPVNTITLAVTTIVKSGMMTSSPGPMPSTSSAMCRPVVPFEQAMPWRVPTYRAKASSNIGMYLPSDEIHSVSRQSLTYAFSLPRSTGSETGITGASPQ